MSRDVIVIEPSTEQVRREVAQYRMIQDSKFRDVMERVASPDDPLRIMSRTFVGRAFVDSILPTETILGIPVVRTEKPLPPASSERNRRRLKAKRGRA